MAVTRKVYCQLGILSFAFTLDNQALPIFCMANPRADFQTCRTLAFFDIVSTRFKYVRVNLLTLTGEEFDHATGIIIGLSLVIAPVLRPVILPVLWRSRLPLRFAAPGCRGLFR